MKRGLQAKASQTYYLLELFWASSANTAQLFLIGTFYFYIAISVLDPMITASVADTLGHFVVDLCRILSNI